MMKEKKQHKRPLRWGFSTGTSMCAVALASWFALEQKLPPVHYVPIEFLDGHMRHIPLLPQRIQGMFTVKKDAGDDPDCTHGTIFYGTIRKAALHEAHTKDYILHVGAAQLIVHALDGVGTCTRTGLDCEQGKWAINLGPRHMLIKNLHKHGMNEGIWLFCFGVVDGLKRAQHSLNAHLGIEGGISILGTTGLVRPFSHHAHVATIELCVRAHRGAGGTSMVFCTGGRTQKGAKKYLPALPDSAFTCIADFIAVSIAHACAHAMKEIIIACMPGKLCKYAAGFENTHAQKAPQDMRIVRHAVQKHLPKATTLHATLANCVTVREALLAIPPKARINILHHIAEQALAKLATFTHISTTLRIVLFDFQGDFLCEKSLQLTTTHAQPQEQATSQTDELMVHINTATEAHIHADYFLLREDSTCKV